MRSCEEYELLASLVVDEEATLEEQAELTKHLESCPACRAYFEDIRYVHEVLSPRDVAVPEGFAARVMFRVRETEQDYPEEQKKKKVISFPHWKRWTALAACCAVAALSVWAAGSFGSGREDAVSMDDMQRTAAQDVGAVPELSDVQDADGGSGDEGLALMRSEDPQPLPEEPDSAAACKEGGAVGVYQLPENSGAVLEPDVSADTMPEYASAVGGEADMLPAAVSGGEEQMDDESEPLDAPGGEDAGEPEEPERDNGPVPVPAAPEELDEVAPAEVIGVPEPGILIAYGGSAQAWVESVLGLEWAAGGSYSLTAEQYGDLIRILDQAGETYGIEPGDEGYCLMTE